MLNITKVKDRPKAYLPLLLGFILVNELCDNYIFNIFSTLSVQAHRAELFFYIFFLSIQILASPIQAGYSDFYCRKKSLVIALFFSALALVPAFLFFNKLFPPLLLLSLLTLTKGCFGNILPLSWAGIADTQTKNVRLSFGLSTSAIALGYLALIVFKQFAGLKNLSLVILFLFLVLTALCLKYFFDIRDKNANSEEHNSPSFISEIKELFNHFLCNARFRNGLIAFLLWEISFYSVHMLDVDLQILEFKGLTLAMIIGYLVGVLFLKFMKRDDNKMIKFGYQISVCALVPVLLLNYFLKDLVPIMMVSYFFYALGAAFLAPSLFAILSRERPAHEQGKIYGLLDSADTVALLFSSIITMLYNLYQFKPLAIVVFSFLIFILSWVPYAQFRKTDPTSG